MTCENKTEITVTPIGYVHSAYRKPGDLPSFDELPNVRASIAINPEYEEGLANVRAGDRLMVLFNFHLNHQPKLTVPIRGTGPMTGVFSTHSPMRPNFIGVTEVLVEAIDGLELTVRGADMLDGTPVLDLKPAPKR